jgi:hypothetical protein
MPRTNIEERKLDTYVQMPWMPSGAQIVDHNLDDLARVRDESVDLPVEGRVVPQSLGRCQSSVQRRHLLRQISFAVD